MLRKSIPINHPDAIYAIGVVLEASKIILDIYQKDFQVEYKPGDEPVTIADKQTDEFLIKSLKAQFPKDQILTEENGFYCPQDCSDRLWIIDPIDGTREFIAKTGEFSIQVGLAVAGELSLGLIYQPTRRAMYIGARGEGCWESIDGRAWTRLSMAGASYDRLTIAVSRSFPCPTGLLVHKALGGTGQISRGGVGLKLMAIAKHEAHYYINNSNKTKAWDSAGPELLFKEAGGSITDLGGKPFIYDGADYRHTNGLLATCCDELHEKILKIINNP
jgi:3'(2'), 5'-bisphosphate nucleotidase